MRGMKTILDFIGEKQRELDASPFFSFMRNRAIPLRERFSFMPCSAFWVMGFADLNKYVLRDVSSQDATQQLINTHTEEDDHHFGMFMDDLRAMGMSDAMDLSDALRLMWGDECGKAREMIYGLTAIIASADPQVRLAIVEALEAAGNTTFKMFLEPAKEFKEATGTRLKYFGDEHLELETGHAMGTEEVETKLSEVKLTEAQEKEALQKIGFVFKLMNEMLDEFLAYARRHPRTAPLIRPAG